MNMRIKNYKEKKLWEVADNMLKQAECITDKIRQTEVNNHCRHFASSE